MSRYAMNNPLNPPLLRGSNILMLVCVISSVIVLSAAGQDETLLLRQPTVSADHVAFVYAGDIWLVDRDGGDATRLTVHKGIESEPVFSPDGAWIAFTGSYDGNVDVYVISVKGGSPRRLTFHPDSDHVRGWSPDGERILFTSYRDNHHWYGRLYTVSQDGGFPEPLPMPRAERGVYSPDGARIAYTPIRDAFYTWRRYRGGQTTPIWLFDLQTYEVEEIPHENASDTFPIWMEDTVYFLSDRNYTMNLFAYDTNSKRVRQVTFRTDFDVKSASGCDGVIVYERGGRLHIFSPSDGTTRPLKICAVSDLPDIRPHYKRVSGSIRSAHISPSGVRAVFEAHGDIFTAPAKKGDIRNLTRTPGIHERYPSWSPDGKWIAYLSDASGEYQLMLRDQKGLEEPVVHSLGDPTFYYWPKWSPDSKRILYGDKRLNLFYLDLEDRQTTLVDTDPGRPILDSAWSPDNKWIAYVKRMNNDLGAVFFYSLESGETHQITDGRSHAISPCFSLDGKYLYFAASTNVGLTISGLDMSSFDRPVTYSLYLVVLNKDDPSPFAPESDEEKIEEQKKKEENEEGEEDSEDKNDEEDNDEEKGEEKEDKEKEDKKKEPVEVKIDLENIDQRILALPLSAGEYRNLEAAADGKLFYLGEDRTLHYFDMKERKSEKFMEKVSDYWVTYDGKKLLYRGEGNMYAIVETGKKPKSDDGKLNLDKMELFVKPRAEWTQMFHEAWRIERDFFYAPNMHGADWPAVRERYASFLEHVGHREDLNYLFAQMLGELVVGHAYVGGGDMPRPERVSVGLLGADYEIVDGYYRIARIYSGENWNPDLRAPLTEPGVNVSEGDYLLAVNGQLLTVDSNLYSLFEKTADRQTVLKVNSEPTDEGARTVTVVPVSSDRGLRYRAWIESNRRKVDEMSGGRVAYVYMPNTGWSGYHSFNRDYFSHLDREAVVIDERFNGGGKAADYIIDMLSRSLLSYWAPREGRMYSTPKASIFGPKVMIINEYAGSGGDAMPLYFRRRGLGKLVGKRTWGGLVGLSGSPGLIDGGGVAAPSFAIVSPDGEWEVENEGVWPDIEVEMTPKLVIEGRDPQLEKAVEVALEELERNPVKKVERPPYPNRAE
jgi:tricorn protease